MSTILYFLLFYWIFAGCFCFGATYTNAKKEDKIIPAVFIVCVIIGGIIFPMLLGAAINKYIES